MSFIPMNIIDKSRKLSILIAKKMRLESALEYMRKEAMLRQATASYEWKYYSTAADSIEKELAEILNMITLVENEE